MQHLDPDRLVLLALSEQPQEPDETQHLDECAGCRTDLAALRHVATVGAMSSEIQDLPAPPERIWQGIEAEIGRTRPAARTAEKRTGRRWLAPLLAAAAAAIVAVAGTVIVLRQPATESVTARATLRPLPTVPPNAGGSVRVLADGRIQLDVRDLPLTTGFHEVWLIDPDDTTKMVALGSLPDGSQVTLPVPPGTDLNRYRLVDVSDEALDGNVAHSGRSLLRGTLTS